MSEVLSKIPKGLKPILLEGTDGHLRNYWIYEMSFHLL